MTDQPSDREIGAFERDTARRIIVEGVRFWVISHFLDAKALPTSVEMWFYPQSSPGNFCWGDDGISDKQHRPVAGKRYRVQITLEDYP